MRRWIEIITEAPIANYELMGDPFAAQHPEEKRSATFDTGTGFGASDRKLLSSPKGIAKVVRAFQKTPHVFEVFFANVNAVDGDSEQDNNDVDAIAKWLHAGIHDDFGSIPGKPGVIRVVALANLSPGENKMPMSGWTLAHKIGHSLQDEMIKKGWIGDLGKAIGLFNTHLINLADMNYSNEEYDGTYPRKNFSYPYSVQSILTMKSARVDGGFNTEFEIFAEVVAQYLITGRIQLNVRDDLKDRAQAINDAMNNIFTSLQGKVLVEV